MKQATIHELFKNSVADYADKVAVRFQNHELTYAELDQYSDQFAAKLQSRGVKPGDYIGLHSEQRLELPIALLGILKTGAAYVPLDEAQPEEHVRYILNEANISFVISSLEWIELSNVEVLPYEMPATHHASFTTASINSNNVASLLYTSGTTGEPKGVMVPHRGVARLVTNSDYADFSHKQVWLQHTRVAFDPSNLEIWGPLLNGGEMVVMPEQELSLRALGRAIKNYSITSTIHTTGLFHAVADACPENLIPLKQLIVGGDVVSPERCRIVLGLAPELEIINAYGPTENTTITSSYTINKSNKDRSGPVPIGKAINGTEILLLNEELESVDKDEIGELCCAGDGVALGYLNKSEINNEKFIQLNNSEELIYRTGDLARYGEDGLLYFEGRLDQQIKLRGFRIELSEIEHALESHSGIQQAVVTATNKPDQTDKTIVAHCVVSSAKTDEQVLKEYLNSLLPSYAVPAQFTFISEVPLDANGKVDRKRLQKLSVQNATNKKIFDSSNSGGETCDLIQDIVAKVIDVENLDINANFFDLGASSLEMAKIHEMLQQQLEREFNVTKMFQYPSVILLTSYLKSQSQTTSSGAEQETSGISRPEIVKGSSNDNGSIAIIAMAGKFPGAEDVEQFWENLVEGKETITRFTSEQLEISHADDVPAIAARGVLSGAAEFDAQHFRILPKEAAIIDPQHRVLLECAQTVLDQAAYSPEKFEGKIGIFAGCSMNTYLYNNVCVDTDSLRSLLAGYPVNNVSTLIGNDKDFLPTRIAHKLNLTGPAVNVQSACSTSLMAVALACENLRTRQCDMALAGGVSISFPQHRDYLYTPGGIASKDGYCRPFDHEASGTVFGDGAGLVALRRLDDAVKSGDQIVAVIKGYAINNDGADKVGYTAPSVSGQVDVIRSAHKDANISADQVGYVETHGTGTQLGDPIEITALHEAFGANNAKSSECLIGSVKGNVGHLETAAGITSLIKTAMVVKHNQIPALVNFEQANPNINFENTRFKPAQKTAEWPLAQSTRVAGVSAFGIGGTNVHMVLEQPPVFEQPDDSASYPHLYPVSASSKVALSAQVEQLKEYLQKSLARADDVALSLQQGRTDYLHRAVGLADSETVLLEGTAGTPIEEIVFMFPGQGSQHLDMASGLYQNENVFKAVVDQCSGLLETQLGLKLIEVLYPDDAQRKKMADTLLNTAVAQPAIFVISYALTKQWQAWGIKPDLLLGHSIGELVAATVAGVFRLEDALDLIASRGSLMSSLEGGSMLSVGLAENELAEYLDSVDLAVVNGARNCVLSGTDTAIEAAAKKLEQADVATTLLHTSHAFHSRMMDSIVQEFTEQVASYKLNSPQIPIYSTVTANILTDEEACSPSYWGEHVRQPVRFYNAVSDIWNRRERLLLEVGPGNTLATLSAANPEKESASSCVSSMPHAKSKVCDREHLYQSFGKLWAYGVEVDWKKIHPRSNTSRRVPLPTYPFQHQRHWLESSGIGTLNLNHDSCEVLEDELPTTQAPQSIATAVEIDTRALLAELLSDLSGFSADQLLPSATLLELGFDSLLLTQACKDINQRFDQALTLRQILDEHNSIDKLAAFIGELEQPKISPATSDSKMNLKDSAQITAPKEQVLESSAPLLKISTQNDQDLTDEQQVFLADLIKRYTKKTAQSKAKTAEHREHYADPRTASGFNRLWKEMVYQLIAIKSKGSRLMDIDGNEYIDLLNGFGPGFLGHAPEIITDALSEQLDAGFEIGPQSLLAMEAAELFCKLTGNERASFVCTGSEAVQAVMRIARTVTGRDKIVVFSRDYHGNFDEVLVRPVNKNGQLNSAPIAPGISNRAVGDMIVLPYGTQESLEIIREQAHQLAAVMVEPVQSRRPEFQPVDFIKSLREITKASGSLLIFDEVITGLRFGPGGAQALYEVEADISTYGKVVGGGMPVGVVAGKARYMDTFDGGQWQYGDDSFPDKPVTFFAGTFVRHPMVMAATKAMLTHLSHQPPIFWRTISAKGDRLAQTIDQFFQEQSVPLRMLNCGSLMFVRVMDNHPYANLLFYLLREKGVFLLEGFPSYVTDAHTDDELDYIINAFKHSVRELQSVGFFADSQYSSPVQPGWMQPLPLLGQNDPSLGGSETSAVIQLEVDTTEAQKEIWLAMLIDNDTSLAYNESISLYLNGHVNHHNLEQALSETFNRHDSLRSTFSSDGTRMSIHEHLPFTFPFHDLTNLDKAGSIDQLEKFKLEEVGQAFDATDGPFVRGRIIKLSKLEWVVIITAHHVVCDGWSVDLLLRDCSEIYSALCTGQEPELEHASSMIDYLEKEQRWEKSEQFTRSEEFWLKKYSSNIPVMDLPTDKPLPALKTANGARLDVMLDPALITGIKKSCAEQGVTFVNFMLAVFSLYLHRVTAQDDIVIGLPASGQAARGMEDLVGHCVNLLPLQSHYQSSITFKEFLTDVRTEMLDCFEHQYYGYGKLVSQLRNQRDPARVFLAPVMFNSDNGIDLDSLEFADLDLTLESNPRSYEHFEWFLNILENQGEHVMQFSYNTDMFEEQSMLAHLDNYQQLLLDVISNPDHKLSEFALLSEQVAKQQQKSGLRNSVDIPEFIFTQILEQQLDACSTDTAVIVPANSGNQATAEHLLDYTELNQQANQIAHYLLERNIGVGDVVGIGLTRGRYLLPALLAVMKTGAAYLPLDPAFPEDRLTYMLEDAKANMVLTESALVEQTSFKSLDALALDLEQSRLATYSNNNPGLEIDTSQCAYLIYTSGSTGRPKGVKISHRSMLNFLLSMQKRPGFSDQDRLLAVTTLSFDIAVLELYLPLLARGSVVLAAQQDVYEPRRLIELIYAFDITVMQATPTTWRMLLENKWQGTEQLKILCGGEPFPQELVDRLLPRCESLWNMYGPTETTVWSLVKELTSSAEKVTIGTVIDNTEALILDENLRSVPHGVKGELFLGGAGLAIEYHQRQKLTAERFIPHPFSEDANDRLYRTGDLARRLLSGEIECLGRIDHQVKLRGFRIELGEIETAINAIDGINVTAVVCEQQGRIDARLVAWVVLEDGFDLDTLDVRNQLKKELPEYMLPALIQRIERMPATLNGKIDRGALPKAERGASALPVGITTRVEQGLLEIWQEILGVSNISPVANFFELGGHSLLAVRMFNRVNEKFEVELPIATLFENPTIRSLAPLLESAEVKTDIDLEEEWSTTIVIDAGGSGQPLFIVGGVGGNVNNLYEFGKAMGKHRPVIGLQSRGVAGHSMRNSIEEIAAEHIRYIKEHQANGPYFLSGYSAGGIIAFEMSRQLQAANEKIGFLGMIDSVSPVFDPAARLQRAPYFKRWGAMLKRDGFVQNMKWQLGNVFEKYTPKLIKQFIYSPASTEKEIEYARWLKQWNKIAPVYQGGQYTGSITLIRGAADSYRDQEIVYSNPTYSWDELIDGHIDELEAEVNHLDLMLKEHVDWLVDEMNKRLAYVE